MYVCCMYQFPLLLWFQGKNFVGTWPPCNYSEKETGDMLLRD